MFGGSLKWPGGNPIAETTTLRFGEGVDTVHASPLAVPYAQDYICGL